MLRRRAALLACGIVVVGLGISCRSATPLANGRLSAEDLAGEVLGALARKDRAGLEALALSDREFRDHVWPELPASRPERNLPYSYVWSELRQKSQIGLTQTLAERGGVRLTLVSVRFAGETTQYPSYLIHREATFRVRDQAGMESDVRVCGSMIEKDGVWKIFSYVVDE